jgi:hypothetical protein
MFLFITAKLDHDFGPRFRGFRGLTGGIDHDSRDFKDSEKGFENFGNLTPGLQLQ